VALKIEWAVVAVREWVNSPGLHLVFSDTAMAARLLMVAVHDRSEDERRSGRAYEDWHVWEHEIREFPTVFAMR
jgi:hypothetical protein